MDGAGPRIRRWLVNPTTTMAETRRVTWALALFDPNLHEASPAPRTATKVKKSFVEHDPYLREITSRTRAGVTRAKHQERRPRG